jgi:lysophospholipase
MLILEKDSRDFYGDVASKDKQLIIYPNLYHEIFNEKIKYDIYQDVFNWIEKRVK